MTSGAATTRERVVVGRRRPRRDAPRREPGGNGRPARPLRLAVLQADWRVALDAAAAAVAAGGRQLPSAELAARAAALKAERDRTAQLLHALALDLHGGAGGARPMLSVEQARRLLLLPPGVRACVFGVDGVLVESASVHVAAWAEVLDPFLYRQSERSRTQFVPFDPRSEYRPLLHGRTRVEGVRSFLAHRGIALPPGSARDEPGAETVNGLANGKLQALQHLLAGGRIDPYEDSRRFVEVAHDAGLRCAVVTTSANAGTVLAAAGLRQLVDVLVDAPVVADEQLRPRPAPDMILAACGRLGIASRQTAVFDTSTVGVAAARAAEARLVVGVTRADRRRHDDALVAEGADAVVSSLGELLRPEHAPAAA